MSRLSNIRHLLVTLALLLTAALPVQADLSTRYTKEHPLVIVSDRDFPPFEFCNDNGRPDGLNVDIMDRILTELHIPYTFVLREWNQATRIFMGREADLLFAPVAFFQDSVYIISRNTFSHYRLQVAYLRETAPLQHVRDLNENDTLILKESDYAAYRIDTPTANFHVLFRTPREALIGIANGHYKYFIWGEEPMKRKRAEMALNDIIFGDIDISPCEMHLIGYDQELINAIDDSYARLEQRGHLKPIYDKWLHPERKHDNQSPIVLVILVGALVVGIVAFFINRLILFRVKASVKKSTDLSNMMSRALSMGNYYVIVYDLVNTRVTNQHGHLLPNEGMSGTDFLSHISPEESQKIITMTQQLRKGNTKQFEVRFDWNPDDDPAHRLRLHGHAIGEGASGRKRYMVVSLKDVTNDINEEAFDKELGKRYRKIFDTNLIAMSFYDPNGYLIDLNDKMRTLCEFDEERERFFRQMRMFDSEQLKGDIDPSSHDDFHICHRMHYPEVGLDKYVELRVRPTFDTNDQLVNYVVTSRDLTEERTMYLQQQKMDAELRKISQDVNDYEQQMRYLLKNSNMYVWQFDLQTHQISFSRSLKQVELTMNRSEYMMDMIEEEREEAEHNLKKMMSTGGPFYAVHHFNRTPVNPQPCWYELNGLPTRNAAGQLTGYFGVCRDITELMEAQEQLRCESRRAEESGLMKSAFLANMTHEIRTPLNAIVGFSDLLQVIDEPADRQEFIRIIRNNCDMLLRLINDILEASDMGQALAIEPKEIDFAIVFNDICQTLAQRVEEPGVEFINDNPYTTFPACLDKGRVQQVITNFVTNAVKYTHKGHIKVGYSQQTRNGVEGIYIYCEDTGTGIPKEKQNSVFIRFVKLNDNVQGTGLGLSICKSIAERCHGHIGVTSEGLGHGSTFWLWIPRRPITNDDNA